MQGQESVEIIGVRGDFLPLTWDETSPMQDPDGDSIYSATIVFDTPFDHVQIKFVRDDGVFELEGQENRKIFFNKEGTTVYSADFDKP